MSKSIGGICSYCSILTCELCISNNKYCHLTDNNRTICTKHIKYNDINIYFNRLLILVKPLDLNDMSIYNNYINELKINNTQYYKIIELFKSFYTDFAV